MLNPIKNSAASQANQVTLGRTVALATEFGFVIAVPLVVFSLIGKWLDTRTHHHKFFVLFGILFALIYSTTILAKRINTIRKELIRKQ